MSPLGRRIVAVTLSAALSAQWPAAALAEGAAPAPAQPANAQVPSVDPGQAMRLFRDLRVFEGDNDAIVGYLQQNGQLTPIGVSLYLSLQTRHNQQEEVESLRPALEKLRKAGPYDETRAVAVQRSLSVFQDRFGKLGNDSADVEESFRRGALREALMTGAAVSEAGRMQYAQFQVGDGFEFYDKDGLAFRMNKNQVTTYNREVQRNQRAMNASRPPEVPFIPETGRYNYPMLEYSYHRLKNQLADLESSTRMDLMMGIAELLGKQYRDDAWYKDPKLFDELVKEAKAKTFYHNQQEYTLFEIVDKKLRTRRKYLEGAKKAVERYEADMKSVKGQPVIADSQVQTMTLDEASALRWLSLGVVEAQMYHVNNQIERVDPAAPDSQALTEALEHSKMSLDQRMAYKAQGAAMADKLRKLRTQVLQKVRDQLSQSDYATSLEMVQAALSQSQKELGELGLDYSIYLEAPGAAFLAAQQAPDKGFFFQRNGSIKPWKWDLDLKDAYNPLEWIPNGVRAAYRGMDEKYASDMKAIEDSKPVFAKVANLIVTANEPGKELESWRQARQEIINMNPDAGLYQSADSARTSDAQRIAGSLKSARDRVTAVTEKNKWVDTVGGYLNFAATIAIAGPAMSFVSTGASKWFIDKAGALEKLADSSTHVLARAPLRALQYASRGFGEIGQHFNARIESVNPHQTWASGLVGQGAVRGYLMNSAGRMAEVMWRQAAFTGMSGGISAIFTAVGPGGHGWENAPIRSEALGLGGQHSMFKNVGQAAWEGAKGGIWWANESWHPWLGYIGLPSTVYRGTRFATATELAGTRGVVGTIGMSIRAQLTGKSLSDVMMKGGLLEKIATSRFSALAVPMSIVDNVAKFALFSSGAGWVGKTYAWYGSTWITPSVFGGKVEGDVERRIKAANLASNKWYESPLWLLLPTYAAHVARDAGPYMNVREGMKQYEAKGELGKVVKAGENGKLPLEPVKPPLSQRIFEAHLFGEGPKSEWIVTKEAWLEAVQKEMVRSLAGDKGTVAHINALEFLRISKMESNKKFVTLDISDPVKNVAFNNFVDALLAKPQQAMEALLAPPGGRVELGVITPDTKLEIADAIFNAQVLMKKQVPAELMAQARAVLKPFIEANAMPRTAAETWRSALVNAKSIATPKFEPVFAELEVMSRDFKEGRGEFAGKPWSEFQTALETHVDAKVKAGQISPAEGTQVKSLYTSLGQAEWRIAEWSRREGPMKTEPYSKLVDTLKAETQSKITAGELGATEGAILTGLYDYVLAIEGRLNAFNKIERVTEQGRVNIEALKTQFTGNVKMQEFLTKASDVLESYATGKRASGEARQATDAVMGPGTDGSFGKELIGGLKKAVADVKLVGDELKAAQNLIAETSKSPWLVRDSKGAPLSSWRNEQFLSFFQALRAMAIEGRGGNAIRLFQMLTTGGGKTMLTFEGLLPYAEADAAANGMKVIFLTVQSNLEAQARMEFRSYRKTGSEVEFDTYEGLKTRIAEGKTKGEAAVRKWWILGDEMDGAGLQPALTIGQVSGYVTRRTSQSLKILELDKQVGGRLEALREARAGKVMNEAKRIETVFEGLPEGAVPTESLAALKKAANDVDLAAARLEKARTVAEVKAANDAVTSAVAELKSVMGKKLPSGELQAHEAATGAIGRLEIALKEDPTAAVKEPSGLFKLFKDPEPAHLRAARDLDETFGAQDKLIDHVNSPDAPGRLADKAAREGAALDVRIQRLEKEIGAAETRHASQKGHPDAARTKETALRIESLKEDLAITKMEREMVRRFESADPAARVLQLDRRIASLESAGAPRPAGDKAGQLGRQARELEAGVPAERRGGVEAYRRDLAELKGVREEIAGLGKQLAEAKAAKTPTDAIKSRLDALDQRRLELNKSIESRRAAADLAAPHNPKELAEARARVAKLEGERASALQLPASAERTKTIEGIDGQLAPARSEVKKLEIVTPERLRTDILYLDREAATLSQSLSKATTRGDAKAAEAHSSSLANVNARRAAAKEALLLRVEERIVEQSRGRAPPANSELAGLRAERSRLEASLPAERLSLVKEHRGERTKIEELGRLMGEADDAARAPGLDAKSSEALRSRLNSLEAERATARANAHKIEQLLASRPPTREQARQLFRETGTEISNVAAKAEGKPGWDHQASRLLERRRSLLDGYATEESALYKAYREMKEDARPIANNEILVKRRISVEDKAITLKGMADGLGVLEGAREAKPERALPELAGRAKNKAAVQAKVTELEAQATAAETKAPGAPETKLAAAERDLARLELNLVERFEAFSAPGAKPSPETAAGLRAQVSRLRSELREQGPTEANTAVGKQKKEARARLDRLSSTVSDVALYDAALGGAKTEALLPLLAKRAADKAALEARVQALETQVKSLEAANKGTQIETAVARQEHGLARLELEFVKRYESLTAPGGKPAAAADAASALARLERLSLDSQALEAQAAKLIVSKIDGQGTIKAFPSIVKLAWQVLRDKPVTVPIDRVGLTRYHALKLMKAMYQDPLMSSHQKTTLFWSFLGSTLTPTRGSMNHGSWVRTEFMRMKDAFHDPAAGVRMDNRTGKFNVVHNGQWFESMDNESRRWWELEYGTDLTLPYTHDSISTIKDVTTDKAARFISLSGTAGDKFRDHLKKSEVRMEGTGSRMPEGVVSDPVGTQSDKVGRIGQGMDAAQVLSRDKVVYNPKKDAPPAEVEAALLAYAKSQNVAKPTEDPYVIDINKAPDSARDYLRTLRANQPADTGLTVLSVSDTRMLKVVLEYLDRRGVRPEQIAKVFADSEYLRLNVPEANVMKQMNLEGLNNGGVRVLILDTRVGGRGLDLNYKGDRAPDAAPTAFRGYTNYRMLVIDPHEMSAVHLLQAMGRIDKGRVHANAERGFSLVMDVKTVAEQPLFRNMFENEAFFQELRKDPVMQAFARGKGGKLDWPTVHEYIAAREADGSGEGALLASEYRRVVRQTLDRRQLGVETDQLISSQVLQEAGSASKHPGLQKVR